MPEPLSDERLRELREQAEVGHVVITSRGVLALIEEVEGLRAGRASIAAEVAYQRENPDPLRFDVVKPEAGTSALEWAIGQLPLSVSEGGSGG